MSTMHGVRPDDTPLEAALKYREAGYWPIPVHGKSPREYGWQNLRLERDELVMRFQPSGRTLNVGVLLGPSALVDIDLDWKRSGQMGALLLPPTDAVFGRPGKPRSHWVYAAPAGEEVKTRQFDAPAGFAVKAGEDKDRICEMRSHGAQTIFPNSIHAETNEPIRWEKAGPPASVEPLRLVQATEQVAAAALLLPYWTGGRRHRLVLAIAGGMLRAGWSLEDTRHFVKAVAAVADDEELADRMLAVETTAARLKSGGAVSGVPTLRELVGDKPVHDRVVQLLRLGHKAEQVATEEVAETIPQSSGMEKKEGAKSGARARWIMASEVTPQPPQWLWPGYLLCKHLNMLGGDPNVGKSFLTMKMVMHVTTGTPWPDGSPCPKGDAVLLCGEDDQDTIATRLAAMGADLGRVSILQGIEVPAEDDNPSLIRVSLTQALHVAQIQRRVEERDAKLVVIDPINTYLEGNTQVRSGPPVRAVTNPLTDLAQRTGACVLTVAHLNKASMQQALYRISGSTDFVAAARSALVAGYEPGREDGRRLLLSVKSNLAAAPPGRGYNIRDDGLHWDQEAITLTPEQLLGGDADAGGEHRTKKQLAIAVLPAFLVDGPRPARSVYHLTTNVLEISKRTVDAAKQDVGIESFSLTGPDGKKAWWWQLPGDHQLQPCNLATFSGDMAAGTHDHNESKGEENGGGPQASEEPNMLPSELPLPQEGGAITPPYTSTLQDCNVAEEDEWEVLE